jgi:AMP nucleosidase
MIDFDQTTIANMGARGGLDGVCLVGLYVSAANEIIPMPDNILSPKRIVAEAFADATAAVARLAEIYERNVSFLRGAFEAYVRGESLDGRVHAAYPFVRITTGTHARLDSRLSYGFVSGPGMYETSVTRPDLFRGYFTEQIGVLMQNHGVPVEIGESDEPIPIHFAYRRDINIAASVPARDRPLRDLFDTPDLATIDDAMNRRASPVNCRRRLHMKSTSR